MRSQHSSLVKRATALVAVPLFVLAIAGCGGDNGSSKTSSGTASTSPTTSGTTTTGTTTTGEATVLKLSADPGGAFRFDKKTLEAPAGKVTIEMKNPATLQHNVVIEGNGVDKAGPVVGQGGTSTATADLKPGKYTFYCSVDGHEQAGMKGALTVR
jgi:plastocyanin